MTGETYRIIYGKTSIDTRTTVELIELFNDADKPILYLRVKNRIIEESYIVIDTDGEIRTGDVNQTHRDTALTFMSREEVRDMVQHYIASRLIDDFGGYKASAKDIHHVESQVKTLMDYYENEILQKKSALAGKEL